jgi:hypothetical protein
VQYEWPGGPGLQATCSDVERLRTAAIKDFEWLLGGPLRAVENLELRLTWRESCRVTKSLTVRCDRVMYLLDDTLENCKLIDRYIEVWEYPDGRG